MEKKKKRKNKNKTKKERKKKNGVIYDKAPLQQPRLERISLTVVLSHSSSRLLRTPLNESQINLLRVTEHKGHFSFLFLSFLI